MKDKPHYQRANLKRKCFSKKKQKPTKRFKRAKSPDPFPPHKEEFDVFAFTDSDDESLGLELSDDEVNQRDLIALTQDAVTPFFRDEASYDDKLLEDALQELHHRSFRPNQKETIKRILFGRSTLFISPTGSGKSLCYQLPALLYWRHRKYITIVVSPLISLMEDQINNFPSSMRAVSLHSGNSHVQRRRSIGQLVNGEAQVAFISPEAIVGGILSLEDLKNMPPVGFVCIDEAHCLSEWSHNFRPAYLQFFRVLSEQMCIKTYLGLTATATKATAFAISRSLTINPETDVIGATTVPENLILSVSYESRKEKALLELLQSPTFRILPSIVVYCNRREETENIAQIIRIGMQAYSSIVEVPVRRKADSENDQNVPSSSPTMKLTWQAKAYHAGLSTDVRKSIQRQFIKGEIRVVVATIAFGMGINKANIRAIIHYDMPSSFESYVQEIGRAGRDGKPAQCHMFLKTNRSDLYYQQRNIYSSITECVNLKRLTSSIFKPCRCHLIVKDSEKERLEKLNQSDPQEVSNWHESTFFNQLVENQDDDSSDDHNLLCENVKEKSSIRYTHKSVVKKHRACEGHEVSIPVEKIVQELNLKPESIMTLICQIQQAYPQLRIKQFSPARSECTIYCFRGSDQLKKLAETNQLVNTAMVDHRIAYKREHGEDCEDPRQITFDLIETASRHGITFTDAMRILKKTEWELVEKTGRFRRTQVRVKFGGNSFHLFLARDLDSKELDEINEFLIDYTKSYEQIERNRMFNMYETFKKHCIDLDKMDQKILRLGTSAKLKAVLNSYFDSPIDHQLLSIKHPNDEKLPDLKLSVIMKNVRKFLSCHGMDFRPRVIARIFQGIPTPNYPAETWGTNKMWWRIHMDIDFIQLSAIIGHEYLRVKEELEKQKPS